MKKKKKVVNAGIVSIAALLLVANVPAFKTEVSAATTENVTSKVPETLSESTQHKGGVWVDYNFFTRRVNRLGWQ